jgi:hypothetical protein
LIERYSLPSFRNLYDTNRYENVYGKSLNALENEWRASLK